MNNDTKYLRFCEKNKYTSPEMDIVLLDNMDVVLISGDESDPFRVDTDKSDW